MSLRIFHIVFVVVTVILSLYVGLWGIREYADERDVLPLIIGLVFLVNAAALVFYGKKSFRKYKELP